MNNNVTPWYYSWPVIIIAFIVFWPVGLALLILRNTGNKHSVFLGSTDKRKYIIAGVVLIVLAIVSFSTVSCNISVRLIILILSPQKSNAILDPTYYVYYKEGII